MPSPLPRWLLALAVTVTAAVSTVLYPAPAAQAQTPPPNATPASAPAVAAPVPAVVAPMSAASAADAPAPRHRRAIEIRAARVRSLSEQVNEPAEHLQQHCRFESDIATPPPAGVVSLSFDDGPEPGASEAILALLDKHEVPASFFLIAAKAQRHPELAAALRANPRALVANHSWSHPNFHDIAPEQQARELSNSDTALAALEPVKLFRYPYGNASCESNEQLHQLGYRIVGWHVDSCDWAFDKTGSVDPHEAKICGVDKANRDNFLNHVVSSIQRRRGGIVLMHEIHPHTLAQLDELILRLKREGFRFVALTDPLLEPALR